MKLVLVLLIAFAVANAEDSTDAPIKTAVLNREGKASERASLLKNLLENYEKRINPDSPNIEFGIALIDTKIDEDSNTLESNVWLKYTWFDSRLKWDTAEYPIDVLRVDPQDFWIPDITLYNSADLSNQAETCWNSNILIYPQGKVLWVPPCHLSSFCKTTLSQHPYDDQTCFLKFGSWTYDSNILDLNLYHNTSSVDLTDFWDISDWKVVSTNAVKHVKYYECCAEPYSDLTFNITLRRKPAAQALCNA